MFVRRFLIGGQLLAPPAAVSLYADTKRPGTWVESEVVQGDYVRDASGRFKSEGGDPN